MHAFFTWLAFLCAWVFTTACDSNLRVKTDAVHDSDEPENKENEPESASGIAKLSAED